jgi:hypothetical protein
MTHEVNYVEFFSDRGVHEIKDIWGVSHGVTDFDDPMIVMFESMYKGYKYFCKENNENDWKNYWIQFKKYQHCLGVTRWNYSLEEEPIYTRANYQILQDLQLEYKAFSHLADYTAEWIEKIIAGDPLYTNCFLGLFADRHKPLNHYIQAVLKNPVMMQESMVRKHFIDKVNKKRDDMKSGKLFVKGAFKFLVPDLVMAMEYLAGEKEPNGCLGSDEFYAQDKDGPLLGERIIERNPHICHSEHAILTGVTNGLIEKYCPNLINVCMVNGKSIIMQKIQGADADGDAVLVVENELMMSGIDRNSITVMDVDDKVVVEDEEVNIDNFVKVILRTMKNLIGEYSNYSSAYHNKQPKTPEQKAKYDGYIDIISVLTGKSIDYAKTGVLYTMPRNIAKYGRPLPWFMRYRSDYYKKMKLSRSNSNMNKLCWQIERWEKKVKWKRTYKDFDYALMIDDSLTYDRSLYKKIERVYHRFCKEMKQLKLDDISARADGYTGGIAWDHYYKLYRERCLKKCDNLDEDNKEKILANICVHLVYEKYPKGNKNFLWQMAGVGIVANLKQVDVSLPIRDDSGKYIYLGKRYSIVDVKNVNEIRESKDEEFLEETFESEWEKYFID